MYQTIAVDQGCSYLLTFYAKVNNGGPTVSVIGNSTSELFISEKCVNSDWSLYSFIVSVGTADEDGSAPWNDGELNWT